jgi:uncharacterized protein with PQ loop repeat
VRVRVGRSPVWSVLATVVGWVYFVIWSASFWPQNISNFRRKSVVGFNLDFAALNVTGFLFYSIFNSGLYFSPKVQALYEEAFPRSEIPIEFNDVVYAYHAAFATAITLVQCYVYEVRVRTQKGDKTHSKLTTEGRTADVSVGQSVHRSHVDGGRRPTRALLDRSHVLAYFHVLLLVRQTRRHFRQILAAGEEREEREGNPTINNPSF